MEENIKKKEIKSPWIKGMLAGFGALGLAIILFMFLFKFDAVKGVFYSVGRTLRPFIIGAVVAYIMTPLCKRMERWFTRLFKNRSDKLIRCCAIAVTIIVLLLIVSVLIILIIPQVYDSIVALYDLIPKRIQELIPVVEEKLQNNEAVLDYVTRIYESLSRQFVVWVDEKLLPDLVTIIGGVGSGVKNVAVVVKDIIIGIIVACYCLSGRDTFSKAAKRLLYSVSGRKWGDTIFSEVKYADIMFTRFLTGKLVDSLIIGIICFIFCFLTVMPSFLLVSVIIGITNIIPFFGPFIGAIPTVLLILILSPKKALIFIIFIIVLQQLDGNVIGPKILGDSTGLSSFWVLFSIIVFGGWFGFIGMIIGVPLFAVIYDIILKLVQKGLKKKGIEIE